MFKVTASKKVVLGTDPSVPDPKAHTLPCHETDRHLPKKQSLFNSQGWESCKGGWDYMSEAPKAMEADSSEKTGGRLALGRRGKDWR